MSHVFWDAMTGNVYLKRPFDGLVHKKRRMHVFAVQDGPVEEGQQIYITIPGPFSSLNQALPVAFDSKKPDPRPGYHVKTTRVLLGGYGWENLSQRV
jgi:hypothetical protein